MIIKSGTDLIVQRWCLNYINWKITSTGNIYVDSCW